MCCHWGRQEVCRCQARPSALGQLSSVTVTTWLTGNFGGVLGQLKNSMKIEPNILETNLFVATLSQTLDCPNL